MNISARSVRVLSERRATPQLRISRRIRVFASPDTAGEKFTKCFPNLFFDSRGRNVYDEEVERRVLVRAAPVVILAVHDAGLLLVELKPALRQPLRDRGPQQAGLAFASGVDNDVIAVALELDGRVLPGHPRVERVVQEHVGEQR